MRSKSKPKRVISVNVLPGEPVDGSGRVCIHLFVRDEKGSFTEPHVLSPQLDSDGLPIKGKVTAGAVKGRIACNPKRVPNLTPRNGVINVLMRTDDPQAVTCPRCMLTSEYTTTLAKLE